MEQKKDASPLGQPLLDDERHADTSAVRQILYASQLVAPLSEKGEEALLHKARKNNSLTGVTGMLLFAPNGNIVQLLEGDSATLAELFETIAQDPRHANIVKLFDGMVATRAMANWTMASQHIDDLEPESLHRLQDQLADQDYSITPQLVPVRMALALQEAHDRQRVVL